MKRDKMRNEIKTRRENYLGGSGRVGRVESAGCHVDSCFVPGNQVRFTLAPRGRTRPGPSSCFFDELVAWEVFPVEVSNDLAPGNA